ncbi:hypothetical protein Ancab_016625 [Ancistrocladus abbreviatus]
MARFAIQTQLLEFIQSKVNIIVEEDEFLVTVTKETMAVADRMGDFERDTVANSDEHIPGVPLTSQTIVQDSNCKLEKEVMKAAIDREDGGNDVNMLVQARTAELPLEVTASRGSSGKLEQHNGGNGFWAQGWPAFSKGCMFPNPFGLRGIHRVGSPCKAQNPGVRFNSRIFLDPLQTGQLRTILRWVVLERKEGA